MSCQVGICGEQRATLNKVGIGLVSSQELGSAGRCLQQLRGVFDDDAVPDAPVAAVLKRWRLLAFTGALHWACKLPGSACKGHFP